MCYSSQLMLFSMIQLDIFGVLGNSFVIIHSLLNLSWS